jgi:hypothetical protein
MRGESPRWRIGGEEREGTGQKAARIELIAIEDRKEEMNPLLLAVP